MHIPLNKIVFFFSRENTPHHLRNKVPHTISNIKLMLQYRSVMSHRKQYMAQKSLQEKEVQKYKAVIIFRKPPADQVKLLEATGRTDGQRTHGGRDRRMQDSSE